MTIEERLKELLDTKDAEIKAMQEQLREAQERAEDDWQWTTHVGCEIDAFPELPIPRLELNYVKLDHDSNGYLSMVRYDLVIKHFLGHIVRIPFGNTRRTASVERSIRDGKIDLPFRDGTHIEHDAKTLNIPAFALCCGVIERLFV